jgi:hypothetical protein
MIDKLQELVFSYGWRELALDIVLLAVISALITLMGSDRRPW